MTGLASCTKAPYLVVLNGSQSSILVSGEIETIIIPSKQERQMLFPGNTLRFTIQVGKDVYTYIPTFPPKKFMYPVGTKYLVPVVFGTDHKVYVREALETGVVAIPQPKGFPLTSL